MGQFSFEKYPVFSSLKVALKKFGVEDMVEFRWIHGA